MKFKKPLAIAVSVIMVAIAAPVSLPHSSAEDVAAGISRDIPNYNMKYFQDIYYWCTDKNADGSTTFDAAEQAVRINGSASADQISAAGFNFYVEDYRVRFNAKFSDNKVDYAANADNTAVEFILKDNFNTKMENGKSPAVNGKISFADYTASNAQDRNRMNYTVSYKPGAAKPLSLSAVAPTALAAQDFGDAALKGMISDGKYHEFDIALWTDAEKKANIRFSVDGVEVINFKDTDANRIKSLFTGISFRLHGVTMYIKGADPLPNAPDYGAGGLIVPTDIPTINLKYFSQDHRNESIRVDGNTNDRINGINLYTIRESGVNREYDADEDAMRISGGQHTGAGGTVGGRAGINTSMGINFRSSDFRVRFKAKVVDTKTIDKYGDGAAFFRFILRDNMWDGKIPVPALPCAGNVNNAMGFEFDYGKYNGNRPAYVINAYPKKVNKPAYMLALMGGSGVNGAFTPVTNDTAKVTPADLVNTNFDKDMHTSTGNTDGKIVDGVYHDYDVAVWDSAEGYANIVMKIDGETVFSYTDTIPNRIENKATGMTIMLTGITMYVKDADQLKDEPAPADPTSLSVSADKAGYTASPDEKVELTVKTKLPEDLTSYYNFDIVSKLPEGFVVDSISSDVEGTDHSDRTNVKYTITDIRNKTEELKGKEISLKVVAKFSDTTRFKTQKTVAFEGGYILDNMEDLSDTRTAEVTVNPVTGYDYILDLDTDISISVPKTVLSGSVTGIAFDAAIEMGDVYDAMFDASVEADLILEDAYLLRLLNQSNAEISTVDGRVVIKIPVGDRDTDGLRIVSFDTVRNTFSDMQAEVQDGCLVFKTNHFGYFAMISGNAKLKVDAGSGDPVVTDPTKTSTTKKNNGGTGSSTVSSTRNTAGPDTGENSMAAVIVLFVVIGACIAVLFSRKKRGFSKA